MPLASEKPASRRYETSEVDPDFGTKGMIG